MSLPLSLFFILQITDFVFVLIQLFQIVQMNKEIMTRLEKMGHWGLHECALYAMREGITCQLIALVVQCE